VLLIHCDAWGYSRFDVWTTAALFPLLFGQYFFLQNAVGKFFLHTEQ